jgi:hypothetical protein
MDCWVDAVALLGPGLDGWTHAAPILCGTAAYVPGETRLPKLELLPPVERRRTGLPVKLALAVGAAALEAAGVAPDQVASVFTSSGADGEIMHDVCVTLASDDRQISPTKFHNSVHNAPSGYWSIATHSHQPSTSLCAYDWSFAAGLLEAVAQTALEHERVVLISYDVPYPQPMNALRTVMGALGVALLLSRAKHAGSLCRLSLSLAASLREATRLDHASLESLRTGNPTGRALPLLRALGAPDTDAVVLDYLPGGSLLATIAPP